MFVCISKFDKLQQFMNGSLHFIRRAKALNKEQAWFPVLPKANNECGLGITQ